MKQYVITVDTGTTNTRTILWNSSRQMLATAKAAVGVRDTAIDGNNSRLKAAVKDCLEQLLQQAGITYDEVAKIIASGMITSNVGLVEIPHVFAPAGAKELAAAMQTVSLPEICPVPIQFIPGVKNHVLDVTADNFEGMDIMRGEEVESCAILANIKLGQPMLLVLPGSHTKYVAVDELGRLTGCLTTITGELLSCITNDTILADAVNHSFVGEDSYDKEWVMRGYETAKKTSLSRACFSGRILNQFVTKEPMKIANYLLGVALENDIACVKESAAVRADADVRVVVAGKNPLRCALVDILKADGSFAEVTEYLPENGMSLSALGAYVIADQQNELTATKAAERVSAKDAALSEK